MSTQQTINTLTYRTVRKRDPIEIVRYRIEQDVLRANAALFASGLVDEIGNWIKHPQPGSNTRLNRDAWKQK